MGLRGLYAHIPGIEHPWQVQHLELHPSEGKVVVHVDLEPDARLASRTAARLRRVTISGPWK